MIGNEDLNVCGMLANRKLAWKIADIGFYEFRRQLEYKAKLNGAEFVIASRRFPSSKMCSACGRIADRTTADRTGVDVRVWRGL